jgi:hypothetical protein
MRRVDRRRLTIVLAASGIAHLGMFALLALKPPRLGLAEPPPIFEVEVVPFVMPPRQDHAAPARSLASRPLRPRRTLRPDETTTVAPLVTRQAPASNEEAGVLPVPSPAPPGASTDLRNALRRGAVGCANPTLLSKAEREGCLEKLGAGAKDAPFIPPPIAKDKLRAFDEKVAAQEQMRIYRQTGIYSGMRDALKAAR